MLKKLLSLIFILLLSSSSIEGQDIFYMDTLATVNGGFDVPAIGTYNIDECITDDIVNAYHFAFIKDLTWHPSGNMYGYGQLGWDGDFSGKLYRYNYSSGADSYLGSIINENIDTVTALVAKPTGELYLFNEGISSYDLFFDQPNFIGTLPIEIQNPVCATYAVGEIYTFLFDNKIARIDTQNPMNSEIIWELEDDILPIFAATTFHFDCGDTETYAIAYEGGERTWYQLNFLEQTIEELCDTDLRITSICSPLEPIIPPCAVDIDLDVDDSTILGFDFLHDSICLAPAFITDEDVDVYTGLGYVDSIHIDLSSGVFNGNLESLNLSGVFENISYWGSGTNHITLFSTGTASFENFESVLKVIEYQNNAAQVFYADRIIQFQAFAANYVGDISETRLPIFNSILHFNSQIDAPLCNGGDDGSIVLQPSGGIAPYDFLWQDNTTLSTLSDLTPETYDVTLTDAEGCVKWGSFIVEDTPILSADITNAGPQTVCDTFGVLTASVNGGIAPYSFLWSNGKTEMTATGFDDTTHGVTITDAHGCTTTTNFTLETSEASQTDIQETICQGEIYSIGEYNLTNDTSLCVPFLSIAGCDSLVCLDLIVNDTFYMEGNLLLCLGEDYEIEGETYNSDTIVCVLYQSINNCDSTVCTTLTFQGTTEFLTAEICEGEEYIFGNQTLTTAGEYQNILMDINGCDNIQNLDLTILPAPIPQIEMEGSICVDGEIQLNTSQNYVTYLWSTGNMSPTLSVQSSGFIELSITNENGCIGTTDITINEDAIEVNTIGTVPSCFEFTDGMIEIESVSGGIEPYLYSLNDEPLTGSLSFQNLSAGTYQLLTEDAEGCQNITEIRLEQSQPIGLFTEESVFLNLGDSLEIRPFSNITIFDSISWTPSEFVSCDTCLQTYIRPIESTRYVLHVIDENGCSDELAILATVDRNTEIYAPTAFSPNFDGINDIFYLQSKHDLVINQFEVFDRWGNLIHSIKNGVTNASGFGWDGFYNGKQVSVGVYVFVSEIVLSDGSVLSFNGDISLY
jgi:gliding motility-associated-like protein